MIPRVLTVSQVNFYVKSLLEADSNLNNVFISGEISNLTDHYRSGHIYFSVKDSKSVIRAVIFSSNAARLKFKPKDGMKIIARGRISLYETTGQYQFYVEDMQPDGVGSLSLAFEQLKTRLENKGYFAAERKKPIPPFPKTIAVITSPTGAAVEDIKNILGRRMPSVNILMCPVLVQGEEAAAQLANAVRTVSDNNLADLVIIGRGGGSAEDLWAFNDEQLAEELYNCKIPVISAVGHETDFTICDFVADLRAPTPSAAAELAVADKNDLNFELSRKYSMMTAEVENRFKQLKTQMQRYSSQLEIVYAYAMRSLNTDKLDSVKTQMESILRQKLKDDLTKCAVHKEKLEVLNPFYALERGFAHLTKKGKPVNSIQNLKSDDEVELRLTDGTAKAKIISVQNS